MKNSKHKAQNPKQIQNSKEKNSKPLGFWILPASTCRLRRGGDFGFTEGFSLIEIVVYLGILGGIAVFVVNFLLQTVALEERVNAERAVLSNARLALEALKRVSAQATEVYTPTSRFNQNAGQLSLVTSLNPPAGHTTKYVDFWVDNGVLYIKEEGAATTTVSAATVRVSKFYLERMVQGLGKEALRITLEVDSTSRFPASATLSTVATLRGNY